MKTTKKPMMAKRTTKAAPAKKKMMVSAKKPMTVSGKKVKKYQVGGNVTNPGRPSGMPPSNPRVTRPGTAGNMPQAAGNMPRTGGVSPRPAPANVGYGGMLGNMVRGRPGMPANPGQGMVTNNRGSITGQSPNYAQANELLARMDPRSPFYNAVQRGVQQMGQAGGLQANNPGGMMNSGTLSPAQIAQNNLARQQLMQQGMTPQQIRAQEDAIRQQLMQRGIQPGQGIGMPIGARGQLGAMGQPNLPPMMQGMQGLGMGQQALSPAQLAQIRAQEDAMRQRAQQLMQSGELVQRGELRAPISPQQMQDMLAASSEQMRQRGMSPQQIQDELARTTHQLGSPGMGMANPSPGAVQGGTMGQPNLPPMMQGMQGLGMGQQPSRFRDGGNVKKKKAPASGRMAKPKGRMSAKGKR